MASAIGTWAGILPVSFGLPASLTGILVQLSTAAFPFSKVRQRLRLLRRMHGDFSLLAQGLSLIEGQEFTSSKLGSMVECVRRDRASKHMHRLGTLVALLDQREKPEFYLIGLLTATGTQMVLAIERWRGRHQAAVLQWLEVWAEMEALCALTIYALEHPGSVFPEFVDSTPELQAQSIGHPLLPEAGCVPNDFVLDAQCRAVLITGSNMAGKSTLLRSVGLNVVLALAGAPVVADSLTLSRLIVRSSLDARDSLSNGRSKFLAEVERLRDAVALARSGEPVLFLIDEILSGTNSGDRREAAGRILCHLLGYGAIGALTTHDLALSSLAEDSRIPMVLAHMSNVSEEDPLSFDYRLRPGICRRSTAKAIVSMLGL